MVKKLVKQKSIKRPKRAKVEVHHYKKPRHPVTLEEFLPSWLRTKSTQENVEASCFNADKKETIKYLEDGIERKIVVDDNPFTEVETHFADAKFYLKSYVVKGTKSNDVKSTKSDKITSKRIDTAVKKVKVDTKELCPNLNEGRTIFSKKNLTSGLRSVPKVKKEEVKSSNLQEDALRGLTLPIRWIDAINLPSKLSGKTIAQNQV
uniref:Uncharacterized protein n=1 Tax=Solanum tuberosum TaxID=4113 RepID=M1DNM4_SOLTU